MKSNENGHVRISEDEFQGYIAQAENERSAAFVVHELDQYEIHIALDDKHIQNIKVCSGIGNEICKEEWRNRCKSFAAKPFGALKIVRMGSNFSILQTFVHLNWISFPPGL